MKFEELNDLYFESLKLAASNSTYYNRKIAVDTHVLPYFKSMEIENITPYDVEKWHNHMYAKKYKKKNEIKDYSPVYLHNMHNYLAEILEYGCVFFETKNNPARLCGNFKFTHSYKIRVTGDQYFTLEEFKRFISVIDDEFWYLLFSVLYFTGMRLGELKALQWRYFNNQYFTIIKSFDRTPNLNGKGGLKSTKNTYSNRQIFIPNKLNLRLLQYQETVKMQPGYSDDWFIFGGAKVASTTNIRYHKNKFCAKAGVKEINLHGFRHSHASLLINSDKNVNILTIANRLGHKDATRVLSTYAHVFKSQEIELENTLDASELFLEIEDIT